MVVKKEDVKVLSWVSTFFTLIGFILAVTMWKDNKRVMHYGKEGLILFIGFIIASFLQFIPVVGWIIYAFVVVLWFISWINAISDGDPSTFIIGDLARSMKI